MHAPTPADHTKLTPRPRSHAAPHAQRDSSAHLNHLRHARRVTNRSTNASLVRTLHETRVLGDAVSEVRRPAILRSRPSNSTSFNTSANMSANMSMSMSVDLGGPGASVSSGDSYGYGRTGLQRQRRRRQDRPEQHRLSTYLESMVDLLTELLLAFIKHPEYHDGYADGRNDTTGRGTDRGTTSSKTRTRRQAHARDRDQGHERSHGQGHGQGRGQGDERGEMWCCERDATCPECGS